MKNKQFQDMRPRYWRDIEEKRLGVAFGMFMALFFLGLTFLK